MTYEWMQEQVTSWLGLQDIDPLDESQLAKQLLYDGTIDMLSRTRCVVRCVQLNVFANTAEYLLDHSILALVDVEDGLYRARRDDRNGPSFTLIRSDILRVNPTPTEDGQVQVWATLRPQQMAAPTDTPGMEQFGGIPDEYHDAIVTYALWKAADYADDGSSQMGERYRTLYEGADGRGGRLGQIRILTNKRGTARLSRSKVSLAAVSPHDAWVG